MTFNINCYWADSCADQYGKLEANSYEELFDGMEEFFEEACGLTAVESFEISNPDMEEEDHVLYEWDWGNLSRNRDLGDVWNRVKKEIKKELGEDFFNKNQK